MTTLNRYFQEPINTLTHLIGAVGSFMGLILLIILTTHDPPKMLSMLIYGLSMIVLYSASTLLHGARCSSRTRMWFNRLDHMAIFLLIAGSYTPIAYNIFSGGWRWGTLGVVWTAAFIGMVYKLFSFKIHGFINVSIYLLMSWGIALPAVLFTNLLTLVPTGGILLIAAGGFIYTVGFVIYYLERPNPWPQLLGHHEIWHLFVMGGSLCHFLFILFYVVPFTRI